MAFGLGSKNTPGKTVGRPAKPGETPNRKAIPVANPTPGKTRVVAKPPKSQRNG